MVVRPDMCDLSHTGWLSVESLRQGEDTSIWKHFKTRTSFPIIHRTPAQFSSRTYIVVNMYAEKL